jgi:hypothetical protein
MVELAGYYGGDGAAVGPVLPGLTTNLLVAHGDSAEQVELSQRSAITETPSPSAGAGSLRAEPTT